MTFGSLFSGVGGLDLGLVWAGLRPLWFCEKDEWCRSVLRRHFPEVPIYEDVRHVNGTAGRPDLVCGGDPCQGNSKGGGVWGRRHEDLAVHFLRVVDEIRPRLVLRENPADTKSDAPWPWWKFRSGLESVGYAVVPFRLRSCCLGQDHRRERVFLLAALPDSDRVGLEGVDGGGVPAGVSGREGRDRVRWEWQDREARPAIRRASDGVPPKLVKRRLNAIGNAVPPPMGEYIGRLILDAFGGRP